VATPQSLLADSARLGVELSPAGAAKLLVLAAELAEWNKQFNLTSIPAEHSATHHLLDSLSVGPFLKADGSSMSVQGRDFREFHSRSLIPSARSS